MPLAVVAVWLARRGVPELPGNRTAEPLVSQLDLAGAGLATVGLGLVVGPLIEIGKLGAVAWVLVGIGLLLLGGIRVAGGPPRDAPTARRRCCRW